MLLRSPFDVVAASGEVEGFLDRLAGEAAVVEYEALLLRLQVAGDGRMPLFQSAEAALDLPLPALLLDNVHAGRKAAVTGVASA